MLARNMVTMIVLLTVIVLFSPSVHAQRSRPSPYDCRHNASSATDPVSSSLRQVLDCYSGGLIAIAEEIPADKYTPQPQHILGASIGHNIGHVAGISAFACSKLFGDAAPKPPRIPGEADKDGLVEWVKSSMEFCKQEFARMSDAKLGESVPWNGFDPRGTGGASNTVTRFAAALWVTNVMIERYSAFAGYMQMHYSLSDIGTVPLVTNSGPDSANSR
jgi:DinB superfamily